MSLCGDVVYIYICSFEHPSYIDVTYVYIFVALCEVEMIVTAANLCMLAIEYVLCCFGSSTRRRLLQGFKSRKHVEEMMQGAPTGTFLLRLNERVCETGALLTLSFVERAACGPGERSSFAHVLVQCLAHGGFRRREGVNGVAEFATLADLLSESRLTLYYPGWAKHDVLKSSVFH
jgi:hypothetical protein